MNFKSQFEFLFCITLAGLLLQQCATPTQPSGGPPDRTPPEVLSTEPASGTTMFDNDRIRFHFSKYVDRNSFRSSIRFEPDLDIEYDISWRRRTATIQFEEPLPELTTIIVTLGTDLSDTRNNRISSPYQLAISTGPEIDEGSITATVRNSKTGEGMLGERVMLYRYPVDLGVGADYVGESNSDGVVAFNYLREGEYKAFWLDDRNRNRIWDREREAAQPFRMDTLELEPAGVFDIGTVYVARVDTVAPVLQAVGMLSDIQLRLRFSESVILEDEIEMDIYNEDTTHVSEAIPLYTDEENPNILFAQTRTSLTEGENFRIELKGITDLSGNQVTVGIDSFPGSGEPDTTYARYVGNDTSAGVFPDDPIVIRYAKLIEETPEVLDSLILLESRTSYDPWPHAEIRDNLLFIHPDGLWKQGENYEIQIWDEEQNQRRSILPDIHFEDELGGLQVVIEDTLADSRRHQMQLVNIQGDVLRTETFIRDIELTDIPEGQYVLRVFEIRDDVPGWDPGMVDPFRPPARYFIQREVPMEPALTSQVYVEWN